MRRVDVDLAMLAMKKEQIQEELRIQVGRWQGVQTGSYAGVVLAYVGLFSRSLEPGVFGVVAFLGLGSVLFSIHMQEEAKRHAHEDFKGLQVEYESLKEESQDE